jgi:hypothetical protein
MFASMCFFAPLAIHSCLDFMDHINECLFPSSCRTCDQVLIPRCCVPSVPLYQQRARAARQPAACSTDIAVPAAVTAVCVYACVCVCACVRACLALLPAPSPFSPSFLSPSLLLHPPHSQLALLSPLPAPKISSRKNW